MAAKKYKKYNQARDILSGKIPPPKPKERVHSSSQKRKSESTESHQNLAHTPSKRSKIAHTPSKTRHYVVDEDAFETPSAQRLFSPAIPTSIGPTPQRDGKILGLFDLLDENEENNPPGEDGLPGQNSKIHATPSKSSTGGAKEIDIERTPMSTSKRAMLDNFLTPSRRRDANIFGSKTPNTTRQLQFSTPSFLRRAPLPPVDANGHYVSPKPLRLLPRKPLGRSLSSVIAGLRKVEEEALDDDMEAMREMEEEEANANGLKSPSKPKPPVKPKDKPEEEVLEPDSQGPHLLGGFDDEGMYDSPTEDGVDRFGQPLRVYKKKGQKRTTRKTNMRPTRSRRPQQPVVDGQGEDEEDGDGVVPETQIDPNKTEYLDHDDEPLDLNDSDSEFDMPAEAGKKKDKAKKKPVKPALKEGKKEGKVQKAAKKVNELAHANFKRLKLKNNGAKGGPGFGSRFRRRR